MINVNQGKGEKRIGASCANFGNLSIQLITDFPTSIFMAAFISVLHLYESFGWWRKADYLKVHFAESWNELHHLLIMEVFKYLFRFFLLSLPFITSSQP